MDYRAGKLHVNKSQPSFPDGGNAWLFVARDILLQDMCVLDWYKECILRVGSAGETLAILIVHPFPLFLLHLTIIAIKAHLFLDLVQNGAYDTRRPCAERCSRGHKQINL